MGTSSDQHNTVHVVAMGISSDQHNSVHGIAMGTVTNTTLYMGLLWGHPVTNTQCSNLLTVKRPFQEAAEAALDSTYLEKSRLHSSPPLKCFETLPVE